MAKGHTLVIPKKEVEYLFDIDDNTIADMIVLSKRIAKAIGKAVTCKRVGMMVIGLEVPHAHIHLIPIQNEGDMNLSNKRVELSKEEFEQVAKDISSFIK